MTDTQLTALMAGGAAALASAIAFLKWGFGIWLSDRKEEREERKKEREANTSATIEVARAMTTMSLKFDAFEKQLANVDRAIVEVVDEITDRHTIPPRPSSRMQTEPGQQGYRAPRRPRQDS